MSAMEHENTETVGPLSFAAAWRAFVAAVRAGGSFVGEQLEAMRALTSPREVMLAVALAEAEAWARHVACGGEERGDPDPLVVLVERHERGDLRCATFRSTRGAVVRLERDPDEGLQAAPAWRVMVSLPEYRGDELAAAHPRAMAAWRAAGRRG